MTIKESRRRLKSGKKTVPHAPCTKARSGKPAMLKSAYENSRRMKPLSRSAKSSRPIASFAGMWANDETFDEFVAAIAANRKAVDVDPRQP